MLIGLCITQRVLIWRTCSWEWFYPNNTNLTTVTRFFKVGHIINEERKMIKEFEVRSITVARNEMNISRVITKNALWSCIFEAVFTKNVATEPCLSCVCADCSSTHERLAAFTKCGYRSALKPHFAMLRLR